MTTATKAKALTLDDLEAGYSNENWGGFGYLGARRDAYATAAGRAVFVPLDIAIVVKANAAHWSAERLFDWTNSIPGRWIGEEASRGNGLAAALKLLDAPKGGIRK